SEEVPTEEPQVAEEDADFQKAVEESMKDAYALPKGPLPPVVIREPESGKYQPLPEVPGKGKAKASKEQVAHDLLSLQKHKKTSPADQYIFQRRVSEPTASSFLNVSPYEVLGQLDGEEESEKVVLGVEKSSQDEGQARPNPNAQAEGQTGSDTGAQAKGQAGSNPDETSEGQAGSNPDESSEGQAGPDPGNAKARVQSTSSSMVHVGSDHEHMDTDVANVLLQPSTEQIYEGFTATIYPNVEENLKLAVEEPVLLEQPASSSGTLSSLQHLSRDFTFGDQFLCDKPSNADKKTEVESMVNVPIQQAMSSISLMTSPIIDLASRPESPKEHSQLNATTTDTTTTTTTTLPPPEAPQQSMTEAMMVKRIGELEHTLADLIQVNKTMEERLDKHGARLYTLEQLDILQQVSIAVSEVVTDAVEWAMQAPLRNRFRDLPEVDMKEILHQRMWETDSYKSHEVHMQLFEALEKSINCDQSEELAHDLAEARKKKKKSCESPKTPPGSPSHQPPPPPPPAGSAAPSPAKTTTTTKHQAWSTPDVTLQPLVSLTPEDLDMDEAMGPDEQAQLLDEEDIESAHIPTSIRLSDVPVPTNNWASALASNYSPPPEDLLLAQTDDIATFMDWFCKRRGITEIVKVFHPNEIHLQYQMDECHKLLTDSVDEPILRHNVNKPLPLGGQPSQVTIQSDFFFNKDLEYLRYGSMGRRPALSISKMKVAYYPDAGLEQMVPDQFWIEEECKYDIAAITVKTHMQILSVVRIEVFSMYGYDYMKKIVLRRADLNEQVIAERDFKYLYPSDFEDLNLLNLQGHLNHLPPKDKKILTTATQVNLSKPQWTATGFEYKHDYTVIESPRAVIFKDRYGVQMMMRFNEIHKFSDATLQQINEALDYRVKEFRINRLNPGLNTRFWTRKDVNRCNALMFAIQRRLRTRRIFRNLESFVRGHIDEALDYRVKEFKVNRMNPGLNTRFWTKKDVNKSKEFMFAIQKRLKTRRIFCNLERFVGGRVRDGDYRLLKHIEKVAVCSSLQSLKPKRTIESRAKRSSKIISLGHNSIMLASSHTVKSKTDIKSPTHYPSVGFNSLVYAFRALSTLRRFGLRTASTAAKPCQGNSLEFYLITGSIYTDQQGTVVLATLFNEKRCQFTTSCSHFKLIINDMMTAEKTYNTASATLMHAVMFNKSVGMRVLTSQPHKKAIRYSKEDQDIYCR
nr:hypothetical protein [Tanacetum cinerariifolium]